MTAKLRAILAANIRFYRKELGLTQEQLAVKCKMHDNYISKVELSKVSVGVDNIERLAKTLKIEPHLLLIPASNREETKNPRDHH